MPGITWTTEKRKVGDLLAWEKNPRLLSKEQQEQLENSLEKFGIVEPVAVNTDNTLIGGHQRTKVLGLMEDYGSDAEIDVRVPSRTLTEAEVEELNIRLNKNGGTFDFSALQTEFELGDLMDWGFKPFELGLPPEDLDYEELWGDMPEFQEEPAVVEEGGQIIMHFRSQADRQAFAEILGQRVTEDTKYLWHPIRPHRVVADNAIVDVEK